MERWLGKYSNFCYGIMRIIIGLLFACHGAQKLFGMFGGIGGNATPLIHAAGIIEFFGGLLIALGIWTGYVAFITCGQMAAAYFKMHAPGGFWPIMNRGELAVLYCFVFLFIASRGHGSLSIEGLIKRHRT